MPQEKNNPPKEKRDHYLPKTRVSITERNNALEKAQRAGLSMAEYQRRAIANDVVVIEKTEDNRALIYQLKSIGNNINQSTKVLHLLAKDFHADGNYDNQRLHASLDHMDASINSIPCC